MKHLGSEVRQVSHDKHQEGLNHADMVSEARHEGRQQSKEDPHTSAP